MINSVGFDGVVDKGGRKGAMPVDGSRHLEYFSIGEKEEDGLMG